MDMSKFDWVQPLDIGMVSLFFFVCFVYPRFAKSHRRSANIYILSHVRSFLSISMGWHRLDTLEYGVAESGQTWRELPMLLSVVLGCTTCAHLLNGKIAIAAATGVGFVLFTLGVAYGKREYLVSFVRLVMFHQIVIIWFSGDYFLESTAIRRALLNRAFSLFILINETDEAMVNMLVFDVMIATKAGFFSKHVFAATKFFAASMLPMYVLGIREYVSSTGSLSSTMMNFTSKSHLIVSTLVPLVTVGLTFSSGNNTGSPAHGPGLEAETRLVRLFGTIYIIIALVCALAPSGKINSLWATQEEWAMVNEIARTHTRQYYVNIPNQIFMSVLCVGIIFGHTEVVVGGLALLVFSWNNDSIIRAGIIAIQAIGTGIMLIENKPLPKETFAALVILSTTRIGFAFEQRDFDKALRDTSLTSGITLLAVSQEVNLPILSFLALVTSIILAVVTQSRLHAARVLIRERSSQAFLAHAVKQKFCGVGNALEYMTQGNKGLSALSRAAQRLLRNALDECRQGERLCHTINLAVSISRNETLRSRSRINAVQENTFLTFQNLKKTVNSWAKSGDLCLASQVDYGSPSTTTARHIDEMDARRSQLASVDNLSDHFSDAFEDGPVGGELIKFWSSGDLEPGSRDQLVETNWDLLRLIVCTWAFKALGLNVNFSAMDPVTNEMEVEFIRLGGRKGFFENNNALSTGLVRSVRGRIERETTLKVTCRARVAPMESHIVPPDVLNTNADINLQTSGASTALKEPKIPPGLAVAILDDNALVRRNVVRTFLMHLKSDPVRSLTSGETEQSCYEFGRMLIKNKIDIAVVDENLEYNENLVHISGTLIARGARVAGFDGCLVLHSANPIKGNLDSFLDGYLEKTVNRQDFISGLEVAYEKSLSRRRKGMVTV